MSNVHKSFIFSFAEKYSQMVIQIVTSLVLARILTPHDIGVFSVGAAIISIAHTLRDFGVSNFLVQTKEITKPIIRTAFGITLVTSITIALVILLSRNLLAEYYREPAIEEIMLLLSLNFFIIPFSSVNIALLKRELRMDAIYKINILSQLAQSTAAIVLALKGFGFMSLAWSGIAGIVCTVIVASFYHPQYAFIFPSFTASKKVLSFSSLSTLSSLVYVISNSAADLIIGKVLNFASVGMFSRANGLVSIVEKGTLEGIHPVMLPYYSRQNRSNYPLSKSFIKAVNYQVSVIWPILGVIAILTYPIIGLLYGATWLEASTSASYLCLALAARCWSNFAGSALIASGHPGKIAMAQIFYQPAKLVMIYIGAQISIETVAKGLALAETLGAFVSLGILWNLIRFSIAELLTNLVKASLIATFTIAAPLAILHYDVIAKNQFIEQIMYSLPGSIFGWFVGMILIKHPLLHEALSYLKKYRS